MKKTDNNWIWIILPDIQCIFMEFIVVLSNSILFTSFPLLIGPTHIIMSQSYLRNLAQFMTEYSKMFQIWTPLYVLYKVLVWRNCKKTL